ncbi:MAG: hypothetical protein L3J15_05825, partial [Devosiaceae bacterium]|nr:hypothetical protein [Devosiaceae bacterium]
ALGGLVTGGAAYLVGEEGPELFTPASSGYVHDAISTVRALSGYVPKIPLAPSSAAINYGGRGFSSGSSIPANQNIQFGDIIISTPTNASPEQIAQAIGDEVGFRVRGSFNDGGF